MKIVVVTARVNARLAGEALRGGASGVVVKHAGADELRTALHEVSLGRVFVTPHIPCSVLTDLPDAPDGSGSLTFRERQVLQLLAEGKSSKEAAALLHIEARTVEFHKRNAIKKTGLHSRAELARYAAAIGLVEDLAIPSESEHPS